ncbi:UNVERIFIED_CONTAM: putative MFS family arabinose efflux permease [Paenibacillus sp. PvR008]
MILSALVRKQRLILLASLGLIILTAIASIAWGYSSLSFDRLHSAKYHPQRLGRPGHHRH